MTTSTTPLPWHARAGTVRDADGVIVCETSAEDAARIVAAVNAQDATSAALRCGPGDDPAAVATSLVGRVAALEGALREYGDHYPSCPAYTTLGACECGWLAVRALLEASDDRA